MAHRAFLTVAALLLCVPASVIAQTSSMLGSSGPSLLISGAPFEAERVTTTVQHIDDGSILRREEHEIISRDADGRVLIESYQTAAPAKRFFILADPATHQLVTWNTLNDRGMRQHMGSTMHLQVSALEPDRSDRLPFKPDANTVTMDLGAKTIAGSECTGTKTVQTIPANTIGNDHALTRSREVWTSNELQVVLAETDVSSIGGTRTVTTTSLKRDSPPSARFVVPDRVTVKDFMLPGINLGMSH